MVQGNEDSLSTQVAYGCLENKYLHASNFKQKLQGTLQ